MADAKDLKSFGGNTMPVRVRPWAPVRRFYKIILIAPSLFSFSSLINNTPNRKTAEPFNSIQRKKYELPSNEKFVFFYRIFDLINLLINEFISRRQKISYYSAYDGSIAFNSSNESISVIRSLSTG